MKLFQDNRPITQLSFAQNEQARAIMAAVARLIPQEGVDYNVHIGFKGTNSPAVSVSIVPITDKGEWWKDYVTKMIRKYPPVVKYEGDVLPDNPQLTDFSEQEE